MPAVKAEPPAAAPLLVLTRPLAARADGVGALGAKLQAAGLRCTDYPLSAIEPDTAALTRAASLLRPPGESAVAPPPADPRKRREPMLLVLASPAAIDGASALLDLLDERDRVAVPGAAGAARLATLGCRAPVLAAAGGARPADAQALLDQLRALLAGAATSIPQRAMLLHGAGAGARALDAGMQALGLRVEALAVYRQRRLEPTPQRLARLAELACEPLRIWVLSQSPACAWLAEEWRLAAGAAALGPAVAIHPRIVEQAQREGFGPVLMTEGTALDGFPDAVARLLRMTV
jgi:uroporphyrinogen-III synthase